MSSKIYSVFHNDVAVVAAEMVADRKASIIAQRDIPQAVQFNNVGQRAIFAVHVKAAYVDEFEARTPPPKEPT